MRNRILASALVALVTAMGQAGAQRANPAVAPSTDVHVAKVVLFSSGVGYFEHAGTVQGNGSTALPFKASQINDILKSLVLQDQDGGKVAAITYASQDPLVKTLKSFQVDITQNPSLADLLNQLRGASVTIQVRSERLTGTILGVEVRRQPVDKGEPIATPVLNLLAGATIRAIELQSITNLSLDDAQLQEELTKALSALSQARDQDKKPVTINFSGTGTRRIRMGYVIETPIWKTSYRLLLDDRKSTAQLQGWAIVENQTESDWNDVSLSLVSGRPMSFMMDLYQPLYSTRPTVVAESFANVRPQTYESGIAIRGAVALAPIVTTGTASQNRMAVPSTVAQYTITEDLSAATSVVSVASAKRMGELFQYTVGNVTLPRQKSAMLPIVTDDVEIERLSIYNAAVLQAHPLNGVRLKNTSGKSLLQGPVTVFDKGGYAGDARIDDLPASQERLLSYGIDLDVSVDNTKGFQASTIQTASIVKGVLQVKRKFVATAVYATDNKSSTSKTLIIEHPIRIGWKLVDTQAPVETTPTLYRFKGTATPNKVSTLTVKEEWVHSESVAMLPADLNQLISFRTTNEIPKGVRDALARAIELRQALLDIELQVATRTQQIAEITAEQTRLRENMKTVAQNTPYYERLLSKLNEQESAIEKLQGEREAMTVRRDAQRRELEEYVGGLTIG